MNYFNRTFLLLLTLFCVQFSVSAQNAEKPSIDDKLYKTLRIKPSETNQAITYWDTAHAVYYNPALKNNKLLIWLAGTTGTPNITPPDFFKTVLSQGYRIIAVSYITNPAVAFTCRGEELDTNPTCAEDFRRMRIYGDNNFDLILDKPQDAVIPRLTSLLQYLVSNDTAGNWSNYLAEGESKPNWENIVVCGQSQGGGMSQFIGQHENVARVISFSGGWDYSNSASKKIASWYSNKNVTPMQNWYATYHKEELASQSIKEICEALGMAESNTFALEKPLRNTKLELNNPYHQEGIKNVIYEPIWIKMLGSGK